MYIDLSQLEELGSKQRLETEIEFEDLDYQRREVKVPSPLALTLEIIKGDKSFVFTGNLAGQLELECSRCLKDFLLDVEVEIDKEVMEDDIKNLQHFDLNNLLKADIFLAIPIKPLCDEDCEGICPQCGQNLNKQQCDCNRDSVDPRMAKLEDFYDEDE